MHPPPLALCAAAAAPDSLPIRLLSSRRATSSSPSSIHFLCGGRCSSAPIPTLAAAVVHVAVTVFPAAASSSSSSSSSDASAFEADARVGQRRAEGIVRNPRPVHHRFPRWRHRVEMYIVQRGVRRGSMRWVCLQMLIAACLVVSVAAAAGSIADVIGELKEYRPFSG